MSAAVLIIENGPRRGDQLAIEAPGVRIGRGGDNQLVLDDDAITQHHARIDVRRDRFRLLDLGSLNGTYVNSARVQMQELHDGDRLQIGRVRLRFRADRSVPPTSTGPELDTADAADLVRRYRTTTPAPRDPRSLAAAHSHLRTILEMSDQVAMFYDVTEVLQHGVDMCVRSLEADRVVFLLRDGSNGDLQPQAAYPDSEPPVISDAVLRQVVERRQAIRIGDVQSDERFASRESVGGQNIRSVLCVPLRSETGIVGACYIDRLQPNDPFSTEQLQLAALMANVIGLRLDHIRLYHETLQVETLKAINAEMATTNAKLREMEQFKSDLVNMLVHDMKGTIATTMMSLDIIALEPPAKLSEQSRTYLSVAKRNQKKLNEMIMNLLDIDRLEEGRLIPVLAPIDVRAFLDRFVDGVGPYAQGAEMALVLDVSAELSLWSDEALLERMLMNLVLNAITHSEAGSTIMIHAAVPEPGRFTLAVEDEGEGIAPELHARIFDKFVQADVREHGLRTDVGLGLAFCRLAAKALGGEITVRSAVGQGSTFTIGLPNHPPG